MRRYIAFVVTQTKQFGANDPTGRLRALVKKMVAHRERHPNSIINRIGPYL